MKDEGKRNYDGKGEKMKTIKLHKYYVTDGTVKARVHYSHTILINGIECVTLYAKDYSNALANIFDDRYQNNTDIMTDYFEKGLVRIMTTDPLYLQALALAEAH